MAIVSKIALNATTTCGYITVDDITTYGTTPDTREEFGLLLLWTLDAWATPYADTTDPGDNTNASPWM